ncbi:hypothetical protein Ancab_001221 [Ancistrocladus abbreviatus]
MGNCGLSASKRIQGEEEQEKQFEFHPQEVEEQVYDRPEEEEEEHNYEHQKTDNDIETIPSSPATNTPVFLETPEAVEIESRDLELEKSIFRRKLMGEASSSPSKDSKGELIDPRLMSILEFFRQLYVRKKVLFRRIISIHREDFVELLNDMEKSKVKDMEKARAKSVKRHHSFSAVRGVKLDDNQLRLQRFKVKTLDTDDQQDPKGGVPGGGKGGGGGTKRGGGSK